MLQTNPQVGAVEDNTAALLAAYDRVRDAAELVVAPELAVCGYPPLDLLERSELLAAVDAAIERIALHCAGGPPLLIGAPRPTPWNTGRALQNTALVVHGGEVVFRQSKTLLPNYDVFDEARYFEPAHERRIWLFGERRVAVVICEDLWNDAVINHERPYPVDPVTELCGEQGADVLVCLSASPFHADKQEQREALARRVGERFSVPVAYVNLVGGQDHLLFDGGSFATNAAGETVARAAACVETELIADLNGPADPTALAAICPVEEQIWKALKLGVSDYLRRTGFRDVVIGLSGGIDSAVTAAIAYDALGPEHLLGITMPSRYSSDGSVSDAEALAENCGFPCLNIAIEPAFTAFSTMLADRFEGKAPDVTEENLQARARGVVLMAVSNKERRLVLTTGNKSELAVGYCTLYGDMCGALAVLSDVPKTMVYRLAEWRNAQGAIIPRPSIDKPPSAELAPGQRDDDSLPPYEVLDAIIDAYVVERKTSSEIVALGIEESLVVRILQLIDRNEFKRQQAAVGLRITPRAFGSGRRYPITAKHPQ
ncbi:MAG: NAD+ synthase (glutamine-hydrolyzing) [Bradymonadia bacterium]|jgi:NAD+ synthase (glutamine-hydrolysing)